MKKLLILLAAISLIIGFIFVIGCSDDDKGTGGVTKPEGDLNDPLFLGVQDPFERASSTVPEGIGVMMGYLYGVLDSMANLANKGKIADLKALGVSEPDTVWYDAVTKYWHGMGEQQELGWSAFSRDSVQFMHGSVAVQWPDTMLLTRINAGSRYYETMTMELAIDTLFDYSFRGSLTGDQGEIYSMGDVTANGSGNVFGMNLVKSGDEIYCYWESLDDDFTVENIKMIIWQIMSDGCPYAGSVTHNMDVTLLCTGDTTFTNTGSWYVKESFANDSAYYVVENALNRWEFSEGCNAITK